MNSKNQFQEEETNFSLNMPFSTGRQSKNKVTSSSSNTLIKKNSFLNSHLESNPNKQNSDCKLPLKTIQEGKNSDMCSNIEKGAKKLSVELKCLDSPKKQNRKVVFPILRRFCHSVANMNESNENQTLAKRCRFYSEQLWKKVTIASLFGKKLIPKNAVIVHSFFSKESENESRKSTQMNPPKFEALRLTDVENVKDFENNFLDKNILEQSDPKTEIGVDIKESKEEIGKAELESLNRRRVTQDSINLDFNFHLPSVKKKTSNSGEFISNFNRLIKTKKTEVKQLLQQEEEQKLEIPKSRSRATTLTNTKLPSKTHKSQNCKSNHQTRCPLHNFETKKALNLFDFAHSFDNKPRSATPASPEEIRQRRNREFLLLKISKIEDIFS